MEQYIKGDKTAIAEFAFQGARICHLMDDFPQAEKTYKKAIDENPGHHLALLGYSKFLLNDAQYDKIIDLLENVKLLRENSEARMVLGFAHAHKFQETNSDENKTGVINNLEACLRISENNNCLSEVEISHVNQILGWISLKSLKFEKAEKYFSACKQKCNQVLHFWGITLFQLHRYAEALEKFEQVSEMTPVLKFNIARCYEELDRQNDARDIYENLKKNYPSFPEPYLRLGVMAKDIKEAEEIYKDAIHATGSKCPMIFLALAHLRFEAEQYQSAINALNSISDTADGGLTKLVFIGSIGLLHAQRKTDKADVIKRIQLCVKYFVAALQKQDHCIAAANGLAICWIILGHPNEALEILNLVREERPEFKSSTLNCALALMKQNNFMRAANIFEECNRLFHDNTDRSLIRFAMTAYRSAEDYEQYLTLAERLIDLYPDDFHNWYVLSIALLQQVSIRLSEIHKKDHKSVNLIEKMKIQMLRTKDILSLLTEKYPPLAQKCQAKLEYIEKQLAPSIDNFLEQARTENEERLKETLEQAATVIDDPNFVEENRKIQ